MKREKKHKSISYDKWGVIFVLPFVITYLIWSLVPQFLTVGLSFIEYYELGLTEIGPEFVGFRNYKELFETVTLSGLPTVIKYAGNTLVMWLMGSIPQFVIAILLAVWFTSYRLNIKGQGFFKTVIYMPNLIMASAFSMLMFTLVSKVGPINQILVATGAIDTEFDFFGTPLSTRLVIAVINFLMWFGNTTIVLMAGIMGIDDSLFEAAMIDGANSTKVFFKITLPLLLPIVSYALITSLIGGINMFDVPYIITKGVGAPNESAMTLIMAVSQRLNPTRNYGSAGALSVLIFAFSAILSLTIYKFLLNQYSDKPVKKGGKKK